MKIHVTNLDKIAFLNLRDPKISTLNIRGCACAPFSESRLRPGENGSSIWEKVKRKDEMGGASRRPDKI